MIHFNSISGFGEGAGEMAPFMKKGHLFEIASF
jgi:hypothetical protein